jgi:peptidoglycan hydrolase-like protein with peptidoglycan-binding domain
VTLASGEVIAGQLIRRGATGAIALGLQRTLNTWSIRQGGRITPLSEDAIFGPLTEAAVRQFQTDAGLRVDGIVGPETWPRLFDAAIAPPPALISAETLRFAPASLVTFLRCVVTEVPVPSDAPILPAWGAVVASNVAGSTPIKVPGAFVTKLFAYARSRVFDGVVLVGGFLRCPEFRAGGVILTLQPHAGAITLDRTIFVRGSLSIDTFVHELVHVLQYRVLTITGFLTTYFGSAAATIVAGWIRGVPVSAMRANPHEDQAYTIESRFSAWHATHP